MCLWLHVYGAVCTSPGGPCVPWWTVWGPCGPGLSPSPSSGSHAASLTGLSLLLPGPGPSANRTEGRDHAGHSLQIDVCRLRVYPHSHMSRPYPAPVPGSCTRPHAQTHTCTQMQTFTYFLHEPHTQAHVGTHTHCAHKPKAPHSVHTLMPTPVCRGRYGNTVSRMAGPAPQDPGVPQHPDPFPAIALQPRPRSAF